MRAAVGRIVEPRLKLDDTGGSVVVLDGLDLAVIAAWLAAALSGSAGGAGSKVSAR